MGHPLYQFDRLTRAAVQWRQYIAEQFHMFGHRYLCVDGRCGVENCGPNPFKRHRILAALVDDRNAAAVRTRLDHDAQRARRLGKRQLVICETHTDCAYCARRQLSGEDVWRSFHDHLADLDNTTLLWLHRDVRTGTMTVVGPRDVVETQCLSGLELAFDRLREIPARLRSIGITERDVAHDLTRLILGNLKYLRQPHRYADHEEEGVVVGADLPGHRHFGISDRVEHLPEALTIAAELLGRRRLCHRPSLVVNLARHPSKRSGAHYRQVRRTLRQQVDGHLAALGLASVFTQYESFTCKVSGSFSFEKVE